MLSASIDLAGNRAVSRHNLGVGGNTSADPLERFDLLEAAQPTFALLMVGTNDARSHGRQISHRMVTAQETERNLLALIELITIDLGASVRLITPPAVDQGRVRRSSPTCRCAMKAYGLGGLLEPDGVHPNHAGQRVILRNVLTALHGDGPS